MKSETVTTSLQFAGDWPWWLGVPAAVLAAIGAFVFYRRDVHQLGTSLRYTMPAFRALAIFMMVVMLAGPVVHHRKVIGELAKLWVFVDGSQSMTLTDPALDLGRKVLIAQRLGLIQGEVPQLELPRANEALADARAAADQAVSIPGIDAAQWKELTGQFETKAYEARELIAQAANEGDRLDRFKRDLTDPIKEIATRSLKEIDERNRALQDLRRLSDTAGRWQGELQELFAKRAAEMASAENSSMRAALAKLDTMPRFQRVQAALLEGTGEDRLLKKLAENYDVQLLHLHGHEAKLLWQPTAASSEPPDKLPVPEAAVTDLSGGLKTKVGAVEQDLTGAVIVFSDGQHNEGESPLDISKVLGGRKTPIYTVGVGNHLRPHDLAVIKVEAPSSVFHEDRIRGDVVIKDDVPSGQSFTVKILDGEEVVWERQVVSENKSVRRVPFEFAVREIAAARMAAAAAANSGFETSTLPVELKVSISPVEGEREVTNNEGTLRFRAVTQKRKILVLDGRPRWETRYLKNMFERDEQWETNVVIAGSHAGEKGFVRGDRPEQFPAEREQLDSYDIIIFGELPRDIWRGEELTWIREFVEKRGGALVFIDGSRKRLAGYADTPLAPLFPVSFAEDDGVREGIGKLVLNDAGVMPPLVALAPDKEMNRDVWSKLKPPHWLSGAKALPGSEVLVSSEVEGERIPAIVSRPFGAGKVLYHAFDDSWRWRFEVADQWHVKYWNQAVNWIAEQPFAVRDKFVSLDAGAMTYQPGQSADVRVRLRDGEGKPVTDAVVDAVLWREDRKVATIRLTADEGDGGLFRGRTAGLEPGAYEVSVETPAIPDIHLKARTAFKVEPRETGELTQLAANEELLRQMAVASGGQFLREENIDKLASLLAPKSLGKVEVRETHLARSWWWFLPIIGLLTVEWILRKRAGLP